MFDDNEKDNLEEVHARIDGLQQLSALLKSLLDGEFEGCSPTELLQGREAFALASDAIDEAATVINALPSKYA